MTTTATRNADLRFMRQRGIFDPSQHTTAAVTLVGGGGIGSFAAIALAKLGIPKLTLVDPDTVEEHNLPVQMFDDSHLEYTKVGALADQIESIAPDCDVTALPVRLQDYDGRMFGLVLSGLDSMEARSDLWHQQIKLNPMCPLYIDARLDGQIMVIYAVRPSNLDDVEEYEKTLYSDADAEEGVCTARNIIDVGFTMAAQLSRMVRLHYSDEHIPNITMVNQATNIITQGDWVR